MAADFIKINRGNSAAVFAQELIQIPRQLRSLIENLEKVQQTGFRMFDGSDFTVFEENYGLPTGKGQTVFDLVNGTLQALSGAAQNANAEELINRVG